MAMQKLLISLILADTWHL